jgi:hypothetical protein
MDNFKKIEEKITTHDDEYYYYTCMRAIIVTHQLHCFGVVCKWIQIFFMMLKVIEYFLLIQWIIVYWHVLEENYAKTKYLK